MYPKLWQGLETDQPWVATLEEAFEFLKESAWVLEDAGYKGHRQIHENFLS